MRTPRSAGEPLVGPRARSTRHAPAPVSAIRCRLFPSDVSLAAMESGRPAQPHRPRMDRRRFSGKTRPSSGDPPADRSFEAADERTYPSRVEPLVAIRLPSLAGPWADRAWHDCLHSVVRHGPNGRNAVPPGISQEAARQNNRITTSGGLRERCGSRRLQIRISAAGGIYLPARTERLDVRRAGASRNGRRVSCNVPAIHSPER